MPSTSSSAEPKPTKRSATDTLSSRYRHLFVLPGTAALALAAILVSLILSLVAHGAGWTWVLPFITASAILLLSSAAVSSALRIKDPTTIATFRRTTAVLLASQLLWLVFALIGAGYSVLAGSPQPLANALLFGAFVCAGFEFLVVDGAFSRSGPLAMVLAAVHPAGTFFILGLPTLATPFTILALGTGFVALMTISAFVPSLGRTKTSHGHDAVKLFQAFMKTWTSKDARDLEAIIEDHAEPTEVTTRVMRFHLTSGDAFIVLPGVHPGPFFPVGSYNLPGLIWDEFKDLGPVMTLHRPGGHERNLASNDQALAFATGIRQFAAKLGRGEAGTVRGPLSARVGKATVSSTVFANDLLTTISFAPLGSDDLEPEVESELAAAANQLGLSGTVVDAHNSLGSEQEHPNTRDPGWNQLFSKVSRLEKKPVRVAYAHSSETQFKGGEDVTSKGVGLLMLEASGTKSVLVLADANNAVPSLRGETSTALTSAGYSLMEFCTSDSHDLAAKGLTVSRGYKALGEATPIETIKNLVISLAKLAEGRLSDCSFASGQLTSSVRVFGSKALDEFASLTQTSSTFAKMYSRLAIALTAVLFTAALIG